MTAIRYFVYFIVVVAVLVSAVLFLNRNEATVVLDLFGLRLEGYSFGLWTLLSFALGAFIGMLVMVPRLFRLVASNKQMQRKLNKASSDLQKSRNDG